MDKNGKILFYNDETGNGIIITPQKEKFLFSIEAWEDYDFSPQVGQHVVFDLNEQNISNITVFKNATNPEQKIELPYHLDHSENIEENVVVTTESVIQKYFLSVNSDVDKFNSYNGISHHIDFLKLRRFLLTTFNNLIEIDSNLKHSEVSIMKSDLILLSKIYDSFKLRSKHIKKAFYELFLNCHDEFNRAKNKVEANKITLSQYDLKITLADAEIAKLETLLTKTAPADHEFNAINLQYKKIRATLVDAIHLKREIEEESKRLNEYIEMIITENEESFKIKFLSEGEKFDKRILELLNKMAYSFDVVLWKKARESKHVREYFSNSNMNGKLSSLTYLKYFLQSLNSEKLSHENQKLFDLVPYLETLQFQTAIYLCEDFIIGHRIKNIVSTINKKIETTSLIDEKIALQLMKRELPDYLLIDHQTNFKPLLQYLKMSGRIEQVTIVLFVKTVTDQAKEQANKIHINHLISSKITTLEKEKLLREILI